MTKSLSVIGAGYLGVTHAACLAELGFDVVCVERDPDRVEMLNRGELPFYEPGLPELVERHVASGRLRATTSMAEAASAADIHFLCTGTPQQRDGMGADTSQVVTAVDALVEHLTRDALLVGKSTVPAGTAQSLQDRVRATAPAGVDVEVAWNPEFLRESTAVADTLRPDRLVIGVATEQAEKQLREIYRDLLDAGVPLVVTDLVTSELVKVSANAFLATKVSFVNAVAQMCETTGADVLALTDALGKDHRIGPKFLSPGLGFGGGCLPKDVRALTARAEELGADDTASLLRDVDAVNMGRRRRVVEMAQEFCDGNVLGAQIAVLGAAFKPGTDDVRDSPALNVAAQLQLLGAQVRVHDPQAMPNARRAFPGLEYVDSAEEAIRGADLVLHLTEWAEFAALDPVALAARVRRPRVIDARHTLDRDQWVEAGWSHWAPGRVRVDAA